MVLTMLSARTAPTTQGEGPNWVATIRRVAEGDQDALGYLYDATSALVLGLVQRMVADFPTAEEITLDVYTQVWRLAPAYSQEKGTSWSGLFSTGSATSKLQKEQEFHWAPSRAVSGRA